MFYAEACFVICYVYIVYVVNNLMDTRLFKFKHSSMDDYLKCVLHANEMQSVQLKGCGQVPIARPPDSGR